MTEKNTDLAEFNIRQSLSKTESTLLASLSANGKKIFNLEDVEKTLKTTYKNAKVVTNRLVKKKWLIRLTPGKYLIVPLEAGVKSQYTEHGFVIAHHLVKPYYIGYQSALNYHGLTDRVPSSIYIVTTKRRKDRTILHTRLKFITVNPEKIFGLEQINISNTKINISDPEKTITDCLDRPEYCGGVNEIAKTIYNEHSDLDFNKLITYSLKIGNNTVIKRLGYIVDELQITEYAPILEKLELKKGYPKLDPEKPPEGNTNNKWKLLINTKLSSRE